MPAGDDGLALLAGPAVGPLLRRAVASAGGELLGWRPDQVDTIPGDSTTATYRARIGWPHGERDELLGCSVRVAGPDERDRTAMLLDDHSGAVAWIHPHDPDLPGLARVARPDRAAALVVELGLAATTPHPDELRLTMLSYRPRRRAVLRLSAGGRTWYVKALPEGLFQQVVARHQLLRGGLVPAPELVAVTDDQLLVLAQLPGDPLAARIFDVEPACGAEQLVDLLDHLPPGVARLERRAPWTEGLRHYAEVVAAALPGERPRLERLCREVEQGLAGCGLGDEPTHGDFHEGQLHVAGGRVAGLLDVDTIGPGRRADDLACLVAHLCTVQRMDAEQARRVAGLLHAWVPVFDARVDAAELRLRAAAVAVSLASGPFRGQEPRWQRETATILDAAETLVRQVR